MLVKRWLSLLNREKARDYEQNCQTQDLEVIENM
jgi:hypothetical protein